MRRAAFLALLLASPASAETVTGAPVLLRVATSRGAGMGGAFTAAEASPDALDYNPASAAGLKRPLVSTSYLRGLSDSYFAALSGYRRVGPVVLMARVLQYDGGSITINQSSGQRFAATAARDAVYVAGAAMAVPGHESVQAGFAYKFVKLKLLDRYETRTHAVDAGARWDTPLRGFALGAAVQHVGGGVKFASERDPLPMTWRVGAAFSRDFWDLRRLPGAEDLEGLDLLGTVDVTRTRGERVAVKVGVEMGFDMPIMGRADVRFGHQFRRDIEGFTFGLGFREKAWQLDYSLGTIEDLEMRHQATLSFWFGRVEEED